MKLDNQEHTPVRTVSTEPTTSSSKKLLLGVTLALVLAGATFMSGIMVGSGISGVVADAGQEASLLSWFGWGNKKNTSVEGIDMTEFWRVWRLMEDKFVETEEEPLTVREKVEGAIAGLVRAYGDPYTMFLSEQDAAELNDDISGNFSGVGMELGMRNGVITVIAPLSGTPAQKAGITAGDVLVSIDGVSTENIGLDQAVDKIRGKEGTSVILGVIHPEAMRIDEVEIVRANIEVPTVKTEQQGDVFIISLYSFNAISESKVRQALVEYASSDSKKLVFDLRDNPGGFLNSAVAIASYFLPNGKVVLRENFGEGQKEELYRSTGRIVKEFAPGEVVVLINEGSASASEILAGALQEHGAAKLIGTNSFGKGSVQELIPLEKGTSLKVTIARWLTPNGTSISEGGLTPDIYINRTLEQRQKDEDPQLRAAIDFLNGKEVKSEKSTKPVLVE